MLLCFVVTFFFFQQSVQRSDTKQTGKNIDKFGKTSWAFKKTWMCAFDWFTYCLTILLDVLCHVNYI